MFVSKKIIFTPSSNFSVHCGFYSFHRGKPTANKVSIYTCTVLNKFYFYMVYWKLRQSRKHYINTTHTHTHKHLCIEQLQDADSLLKVRCGLQCHYELTWPLASAIKRKRKKKACTGCQINPWVHSARLIYLAHNKEFVQVQSHWAIFLLVCLVEVQPGQ